MIVDVRNIHGGGPGNGNGVVPPAEALRRLAEGNGRFANELTSMRARLTATREMRAHLAERQTPFAVVASCSDSRVPAELIFDQGLGDLFIVRNAGAVLGHAPLASIEFAVERLETRLVVVLAHEGCGAFRAAYDAVEGDGGGSESMQELVRRLRPALDAAHEGASTREERCELASALHSRSVARTVAESPVVAPLVRSGEALVVPALYRMKAGTVEFFDAVILPGSGEGPASEVAAGPANGEVRP